jgi:Flp pilus assembly protein TadD
MCASTGNEFHLADTILPGPGVDAAEIAARHLKEGRVLAAQSIYSDLRKKDPRDRDAISGLATIALQSGETQRAIEMFGYLATSVPNDPKAQLNLGVAYRMAQRLDDAGACFQRAIELDPSSPDAHANLAAYMVDKEDIDAAFNELSVAIDLNPASADFRFNLANLHFQQGRLDLAEPCYRGALELDGDHVGALNNLALVLRETGRHDEAIGCMETALLHQPNDPAILAGLADHLFQAGRFTEAEGLAAQAVTLAPGDGTTRGTLAMIRMNLGQVDDATKGLVEAARLSPDAPEIPHNLAIVLRRRDQLDAALTAAKRAVGLSGGSLDNHQLLYAELLLELGRHADGWSALDALREASMATNWTTAPLNLADLSGRNARFVTMDATQAVFASRFLTTVAPHLERIEIVCPPLLQRFFESFDVISEVKPADAIDQRSLTEFDGFAVLLEDLPRLLRATPELSARPMQFALRPARLESAEVGSETREPRIGVWCEGDMATQDLLTPLVGVSGNSIFSLQTGEIRRVLGPSLATATDVGRDLSDFHDLAEAMLAMDLVVAPEGIVAHIAGILGLPSIVLTSASGRWHWPHGQDTSPWYPRSRMLRQSPNGSWDAAIKALIEAVSNVSLPETDDASSTHLNAD